LRAIMAVCDALRRHSVSYARSSRSASILKSTIPADLQKEHTLGARSPFQPKNGRRPSLQHFSHRMCRTLTILSILQVRQWLGRKAGGKTNPACAPQAHRGEVMSTISANLHFEQQLGLAASLKPKWGRAPHLHLGSTRSTMSTDLHLLQ